MSDYSISEKLQLAVWYITNRIRRNLSLTNPKSWNPTLWNLYGVGQTEAGIKVDENSALNLAAVYAAINIISGDISTLPLGLFKTVQNKRKRITDHKSLQVLTYRANPVMPAINVRRTLTAHMLSWGNLYAEIVRDGMNNVVEIWPLTPDRVAPKWKSGTVVYEIDQSSSKPITLPKEKVLHISGLGYNGITGYSVISKAAESIGLSMASEKFGARYFGANTNMGGAIKYPRALGPDAKKNLAASLSGYTGSDNSHRWMILEQGMEIEKLGFSPDDSQFLQTRQFQVPEIARWFNMPPHKLKDLTRSTFSNIEEQETEYVVSCLVPWLTIIEQNYNIQLLTEKEHRLGYYFKHNVKGLLRGSSSARAEYYTKRFYLGTITPNEIRAFEDEDPLETEYADKTYIQQNLMPLEDVDKEPPAPVIQNMPGEQPVEEEPPGEEEVKTRIAVLERANTKLIEYRSIAGRDKISNRYYPLIRDAAERIVLKEAKAISKNVANGKTWVDNFYKQMPEYIRKQLGPVMSSFQESVMDQAAREVGGIDTEKILDEAKEWIDSYLDVYVKRHIGRSTGQVNQLMDEEDSSGLVTQRMDEWMERRPEKIAGEETVRGANSAAQFIFWSRGAASVWRIRGAETCDYCKELNGRKIRQGQTYFNGGEDFQPRGFRIRPMHISGPISHPPLHQGCDCYIEGRAGEGTPTEIPGAEEPFEFKPAKDLNELDVRYKKIGVKRGAPVFRDYTDKIALKRGNELLEHFEEMQHRMPKLAELMKAKGNLLDDISIHKTDFVNNGVGECLGYYDAQYKQIVAGGKVSLKNEMKIGGGAFAGGEDFYSIMRHEYGHHFEDKILDNLPEFEKSWKAISLENNFYFKNDYFRNNISEYAGTNRQEAFAECFSIFTSPLYKQSSKKLPAKIDELFRRELI